MRFRELAIRHKLWIGLLVASLMPLFFFSFLVLPLLRDRLNAEAIATLRTRHEQGLVTLQARFNFAKQVYYLVNTQLELIEFEGVGSSEYSRMVYSSRINSYIQSLIDQDIITGMRMYLFEGSTVLESSFFAPAERLTEWNTDPGSVDHNFIHVRFDRDNTGDPRLFMTGPFFLSSGQITASGIIIVRLGFDGIERVLRNIVFETKQTAILRSERDDLVIAPERQPIPDFDERTVVFRSPLGFLDWELVSYFSRQLVFQETNRYFLIIVAVLAILLAAAIPVTIVVSRSITRRIEKLVATFEQARQNDAPGGPIVNTVASLTDPNRGDEIDVLFARYNAMAARIQRLITEVYETQVESAQRHLEALRAQIDPHFLYNTLDSIRSNINLDNRAKAGAMLRDLADFFRVSLGKGRETIVLKDELEATEMYLSLYRSVYGTKIVLEIDVPEDLQDAIIPRFSIQPIIENSLVHGFGDGTVSGAITVTAAEEEHILCLSVDDNGVGMGVEQVDAVNAALERGSLDSTGYGLYNVNRRLQLRYGADFGARIAPLRRDRNGSSGITVELRIPLEFADADNIPERDGA